MIEPAVVDLDEVPAAVVRATVAMSAIRDFYDGAFGELFAALGVQGLAPVGPPYGRYRGMPGETVDVELGVPVAGTVAVQGRVAPGGLPACRAATAVHAGAYDGLPGTYAALADWAAAQGLALADEMWEVYLTDPSSVPDPGALRTQVVWRLAGD